MAGEDQERFEDYLELERYLETLERVFGGTDKIIIDQGGAGASGNTAGVLPVLPLNDMARKQQTGGNQ